MYSGSFNTTTGRAEPAAPTRFEIIDRAVEVWPVRVPAAGPLAALCLPLLAPDEIERAGRYRFDHLRHRFVIARGALRALLGLYLRTAPREIEFSYGAHGKPSLSAATRIRFNASQSGDLALVAITQDCEIGIDVEQVRPLPQLEEIAQQFFCAGEAEELLSLPAGQRETGFFLCWTRKEACVKATGCGLSAPLDSYPPGGAGAGPWTIHDIELTDGYAGALAYRDTARPVRVLPIADAAELLQRSMLHLKHA